MWWGSDDTLTDAGSLCMSVAVSLSIDNIHVWWDMHRTFWRPTVFLTYLMNVCVFQSFWLVINVQWKYTERGHTYNCGWHPHCTSDSRGVRASTVMKIQDSKPVTVSTAQRWSSGAALDLFSSAVLGKGRVSPSCPQPSPCMVISTGSSAPAVCTFRFQLFPVTSHLLILKSCNFCSTCSCFVLQKRGKYFVTCRFP